MTTTPRTQTTTLATPTPPLPPHWAPDPGLRGQLRWWDGTRWTEHTHDALTASRPALPPSFRSMTHALYAVTGLVGFALFAMAALVWLSGLPVELLDGLGGLVMTGVTAQTLLVGGWAYLLSGSRRVDPSRLHRDRIWLLVAWFVPVIHVVFTHQLFRETWWGITAPRGGAAPSRSPRVLDVWAWTWAAASVWMLAGFFGAVGHTWRVGLFLLTGAATLLLGGVVWVLARREAVTRVVSE
ncbi:uncharacterized protein DUF2510 [Knoellia remsis]|uniref:Uncharacterized protein DUF2510 n=1 Tax=Knoellia remsis TaxID=407159 RepID=A0A2T0UCI0_9MICO|nr:DUF2510 domain-containing protein [Knoellia remsis]PRY55645.1 uncharacterized protein DUF2510 [Knoellia remsis]